MPKKYPRLSARDVVSILTALGFKYSHSEGGHDFYKATHSGRPWKVTVDPNNAPFDEFLLKSMINQSGYSRDRFYGATKRTAKMVGLRPVKAEAEADSQAE